MDPLTAVEVAKIFGLDQATMILIGGGAYLVNSILQILIPDEAIETLPGIFGKILRPVWKVSNLLALNFHNAANKKGE